MSAIKTPRVSIIVLLITSSFFILLPALADIITLKNGDKLEGIISARSPESVLIKVPEGGLLNVSRTSIEKIEKSNVESWIKKSIGAKIDDLVFLSRGDYYRKLQKVLKDAEKSIQVMMYLVNYRGRPGYPANKLVNLLVEARKRGVEIEVLLESSTSRNITEANQKAGEYLKKHGISVRYFPVFPIMHVKMVIVDGETAIIGSHNWTLASTKSNVESSVLIKSKLMAQKCGKYFRDNFLQAKP